MLLTLIIILLLIGSAVVGAIYSNFTVFYRGFGETENYNKAYYAAISALERAELVIKQRSPGYEGSGGRIGDIINNSTDGADGPISNFSYLGSGNQTDMLWEIKSRAKRIPTIGKGDLEPELVGDPSQINYNKMDYENAEVFLLYYDTSTGSPYVSGTNKKSALNSVSGSIRLPQNLRLAWGGTSGLLDDKYSLLGQSYDNRRGNDAIVDRQIRGNYLGTPFTIFAIQNYVSGDSAIRESDLNGTNEVGLNFLVNNENPITSKPYGKRTIISKDESTLKNMNLRQIFLNSNNFTDLNIRLSLLNLLKTKGELIYPYLEYYIDFKGDYVSDKYYTITTRGKIADFQVDLTVQRPTIKESILGNFTVIF